MAKPPVYSEARIAEAYDAFGITPALYAQIVNRLLRRMKKGGGEFRVWLTHDTGKQGDRYRDDRHNVAERLNNEIIGIVNLACKLQDENKKAVSVFGFYAMLEVFGMEYRHRYGQRVLKAFENHGLVDTYRDVLIWPPSREVWEDIKSMQNIGWGMVFPLMVVGEIYNVTLARENHAVASIAPTRKLPKSQPVRAVAADFV